MPGDTPLFAGLKVIDCASYIAAPTAATVLADYGADVIKIEAPGEGDPWRLAHTRPGLPNSPHNYPYLVDNRNKRGLAIDLKSPAGREVLERLIATTDVFITNLPLPVRARLRVRYQDFAEKYPRLIYGSFTAYGEEGEESGKTGFDLTAYWARSGLMDQVRADPNTTPARSVAGMGDHPTGMAFYSGILTALYRREKTGRGGEVRSSLLANGLWANAFLVQAALVGAETPVRPPREQTTHALGGLYQAGDGRYFLLALTSELRQWPALAKAIGHPELIEDPRFIDQPTRRANARALQLIFDAAFAQHPLTHWRKTLDEAGLTFGIVGTAQEAATDHQARAAGILKPMGDSNLLTVDSPFTLEGSPKVPPTRHPEHGEHSRQILRDAGYGDAEIETLHNAGTIGGP
ncbi:MAG: CoA transferase [Acetobacteraceae bacterium]|nr:CoA transferase [Acetobacteraceae bacterium]